jgi:hypothetical protein
VSRQTCAAAADRYAGGGKGSGGSGFGFGFSFGAIVRSFRKSFQWKF